MHRVYSLTRGVLYLEFVPYLPLYLPNLLGMLNDISKAMARLDNIIEGEVSGSYSDYQSKITDQCEDLNFHIQDMLNKFESGQRELAQGFRLVVDSYCSLVDLAQEALATTDSVELTRSLKKAMAELGDSCKALVYVGASLQGSLGIVLLEEDLVDTAKDVTNKVRGSGCG